MATVAKPPIMLIFSKSNEFINPVKCQTQDPPVLALQDSVTVESGLSAVLPFIIWSKWFWLIFSVNRAGLAQDGH